MEDTAYMGTQLNSVDGKNRLSVPSDFRDLVKLRSNRNVLMLSEHPDLPCIVAADMGNIRNLRAEVAEVAGDTVGARRKSASRSLFGAVDSVPFDGTGRMSFDPDYQEHAGIEKYALFIGADTHFEIWDPNRALAHFLAEDDRMMARIVRRVMRAKGLVPAIGDKA